MQRAQAEHLRCVGLPDQAAVNGLDDATMLVYTLEGIAGRHSQQATHRIVREFGEQFVEIVTTQVRPRRIMHQDPIIITGAQGIELQQRIEYRARTLRATVRPLDTRSAAHAR